MKALEDLEAAFAAATQGEWEHFNSPGMSPDLVFIGEHGVATLNGPEYQANAHLIALMHNALPALIECAKALQRAHRFLRKNGYDMGEINAALAKLQESKS